MGLREAELFEEIGDLCVKEHFHDLAVECFERVVDIDPDSGEGWQKLGDVHANSEN